MFQLSLHLQGGETLFGGGQKVHSDEPIAERELGVVHYGVSAEALPVSAVLALEAFLVVLPIMLCAAAFRAHYALLFA